MDNIRIVFMKRDRAKYISHLDLNRCMQRTFKRSRLPIWYTEGFNPHAYIMFALALALGTESDCEIMDIKLVSDVPYDEVKQRLNAALPPDIRVMSVARQIRKHTDIAQAEYEVDAVCELQSLQASGESFTDAFARFLQQDKIEIEKKSKKKGVNIVDLKPLMEVRSWSVTEDTLKMTIRLAAGVTINVSPALVLEAFTALTGASFSKLFVLRTKILCHDGEEFA